MTRRLVSFCAAPVLVAAILLLLITGCEEAQQGYDDPGYVPSAGEMTRIATEWPDDDPLKPTAQAVALERFATAQAHESAAEQAEATRQAAQDAAEREYVILTTEAQMTTEACQRTVEAQHIWATQQAANATQVAQATAQALAVQATTEARHTQATATERAYRATATRQVLDQWATATVQAVAMEATATRQEWEARVTATAESHRVTQAAYQATATRQAQKRDEILAYGRDYGIPLVLLALMGGLVFLIAYGVRQMAKRPQIIQRDVRGDAPLLVLEGPNGERDVMDLDRQPGHVTRLLSDGRVEAPQFRSAGQEERTTARDQMVDQATRPRPGAGRSSRSSGQSSSLSAPPPPRPPAPGLRSVRVLRRLDQAGRAGFLPGPLLASLQADWEVEQ